MLPHFFGAVQHFLVRLVCSVAHVDEALYLVLSIRDSLRYLLIVELELCLHRRYQVPVAVSPRLYFLLDAVELFLPFLVQNIGLLQIGLVLLELFFGFLLPSLCHALDGCGEVVHRGCQWGASYCAAQCRQNKHHSRKLVSVLVYRLEVRRFWNVFRREYI